MKNIKSYNESIREYLKPKSTEEIKKSLEQTIVNKFEESYENGESNVNINNLGNNWDKYSEPYHLIDNYYLYKNILFTLYDIYQYDSKLVKSKESIENFKSKLIIKKDELENAIQKLEG